VRELAPGSFRPRSERAGRPKATRPEKNGGAAGDARPSSKKKKGEKAKFDVTCNQCGQQAQVPFRPIEGREVFCQPCYQARRGVGAPPAVEDAS
jgi:CxxC-x17-CxxC domain-containing protein